MCSAAALERAVDVALRIPLGDGSISIGAAVACVVVAAGIWLAHATAFGRTVYAVGGDEAAARLMGLRVDRTVVGVYVLSGFCAALAGVVVTLYMLSGYSLHGSGLELDPDANAKSATRISRKGARVTCHVIPTDEELMIARHTLRVMRAHNATMLEEKRA